MEHAVAHSIKYVTFTFCEFNELNDGKTTFGPLDGNGATIRCDVMRCSALRCEELEGDEEEEEEEFEEN